MTTDLVTENAIRHLLEKFGPLVSETISQAHPPKGGGPQYRKNELLRSLSANLRDGSAPLNLPTPDDTTRPPRLPTPADIMRPPRLGTADAVKYLYEKYGMVVAPSTLKQWAWRGGGPEFQKSGPHRIYPVERLDVWAEQRLTPVVASTSELTSLLTIGDPVQEPAQSRAPIPDRADAKAGAVKGRAGGKDERPTSPARPRSPPGRRSRAMIADEVA